MEAKSLPTEDGTASHTDRCVTFLKIPTDPDCPLEMISIHPDQQSVSVASEDSLQSQLASYTRLQMGEMVDMSLLQQEAYQARDGGCAGGMCPHVSPLTLQRSAEEGTLVKAKICDDGSPSQIFLYWDESAHLKQRLRNERAIRYLSTTSSDSEETIHGDAFLVRVHKDGTLEPLKVEHIQMEKWYSGAKE